VRERNPGATHPLRVSSRRVAQEKAAFGAIRALSIMTIAILALIMGFILYKGLRFSNETRSAVLPYAESAPEGLSLVVNRETELRNIEFPVLYGMYTDEYINWSKISADGFDLLPVAIDGSKPEGATAAGFLFGDPAAAQWGALVKKVSDAASALALVDSTPGAAALVPAAAFGDRSAAAKYSRVRAVPIRRLVLAVNDDAAALVDNRSVEDLGDAAIARLTGGSVPNWKELGGPDLAVKLLSPLAGSSLASALAAAGYKSSGAATAARGGATGSTTADYAASIYGTSGAVGFLFASDAQAAGLQTLTRKGIESGWNLTLRYLFEAPRLSGKVGGISTIILNTLFMLILTIAIAAPIGVAAAVYLVEYAKQGPLVGILRLGTETLAGIPSIIFGLFGFLFFVNILHFGFGLLSGCLTLSLMVLPTIVRTSEEALKSVPSSLREGSLALGATKLQTIVRVAIPAAASGILTGLILGIGRAVGETAALIFTMGSDYKLAKGLFSSARVLSSHVYLLFAEGISFDRAFSTATVLIAIVLLFNFAARRLIGRMGEN
jgi:phosphate transport system permease protein